jgi:hypothetical protein
MLRRPKIECSSSYADCRPKTNAVILLDMGHTLKGEHAWKKYRNGRKHHIFFIYSSIDGLIP